MSHHPLIEADDLAHLIAKGEVLVCDCRFDLADPGAGRLAYVGGHIPGAVYVDLDHDLSGVQTGTNGRHPLPDRIAFAERMAKLGVAKDKSVVSYDASGGYYASRLWWMLRWAGHDRAAILNGGLAAWIGGGRSLEPGEAQGAPGNFLASADPEMAITEARGVEANLDRGTLLVLDARTAERFGGAPHPLDTVAGHIPGAANRFWQQNLEPDGRFKSAEMLAAEFGELLDGRPPETIVHQCGSGVTATQNLLAMEIAGLHGSQLYPGSWSEWVSDPRRPIAREL